MAGPSVPLCLTCSPDSIPESYAFFAALNPTNFRTTLGLPQEFWETVVDWLAGEKRKKAPPRVAACGVGPAVQERPELALGLDAS